MYSVKSGAEFLEKLRELDPRLKNLRLHSIEVDRKGFKVTYNFISDEAVDEELKGKLLDRVFEETPEEFRFVEITVKKIVSNEELVCGAIFNYLKENYPSVSIFLKPTDVVCANVGGVVKYTLRLSKDGADYVVKSGVIRKLNDFLGKNFCSDFAGNTEVKEADEMPDITDEVVFENELQRIEHRTIKVEDPIVIDDPMMGDIALYIEDAVSGSVTVCGKITELSEKQTKNGKPFLIIHIDDTTGKASGVYFSKKNTYGEIRKLQVGDAIIARGSFGEFNGRKSFTFDKINRCTFPADFVKKERFKKSAPREYKLVFPEPATTVKVSSVFDMQSEPLPKELTEETYVVFDLETTGIDLMTNGITEIGAVKLVGGVAKEQFTTLVKPDYPISDEIVKLTGITPEMVANAPKIGMVLPDFMKFIDGAVLVAHNAEFDTRFIKRFAAGEDYEVKNRVMDTLEMSRKYLPQLRKNGLGVLAEYFGVVFHHHRALSDAYATAEIFVELMKIKAKKGE